MSSRFLPSFLICAAVALAAAAHLHAQAPAIPQQKESDPNLPPKGGSWSLREATVTDASLPRVLLIGDSITNSYLEPVRKALAGKANIDAWITPTTQADKSLPKTIAAILGWQKYAVVHFNLGLHGWQAGRIPEGQYEPLTRQFVQNLRAGAPQATLIWATITPVTVKGEPEKLNPDIQPTIEEHNRLALTVMKSEGVEIDDLAGLMAKNLPLAAGDMFHWKAPGVALLTESVMKSIASALAKPQAK
ncbi:MAG: SGNH/GDSL hydrolase family protein [Chthoniobacter sp.]|uniref:SGNH/GDSL hydrolase family protein n=1 Tax=Chthoniobacter sp. TaxID=2510640 RepID=UPI0032AB40D4